MRTQRKWSAQEIYNVIAGFANDPGQRAYAQSDGIGQIQGYVADGGDAFGVSLAAMTIGKWWLFEGTNCLIEQRSEGVELLHAAACAELVHADVWRLDQSLKARNERLAVGRLDRSSFPFATFLALGAIADAELSFQFLMRCLREDMFFRPYFALYPRYAMEMYAAWKGEPVSLEGFGFRPMHAYGDLLALWNTEDLSALSFAISAACDLHIARSRASTNTESFEFDQACRRVFPAEILCLLRLRELKALPNPVVDHPLMNLSTAKLYPGRDIPWNPVLLAGYEKARAELDERKKSVVPD